MTETKPEANLGYLPTHFDSQTGKSPTTQEPVVLPNYLPGAPVADLGMAYPAYEASLPLLSYDHYASSPLGMTLPNKQPYHDRQVPQVLPPPEYKRHPEIRQPPSAPKQLPQGQGDVSGQNGTTSRRSRLIPKTVHPILSLDDPARQAKPYSPLDLLMQKIQAKPDTEEIVRQREAAILGEGQQTLLGAKAKKDLAGSTSRRAKRLWLCEFPTCGKAFRQRCQLKIHNDIHTGVRRYVCNWPGCGRTSSQPGNLKAHMRRHTGEKPFVCDICDKAFPVKGNLNSHRNTHLQEKPFVCRMPGCNGNKRFTQRGNLKNHQDKFHREFTEALVFEISQVQDWASAPKELRAWAEYLAPLYKNLNKGIKGRGRGTAVTPMALQPQSPPSSPEATTSVSSASPGNHFAVIPQPSHATGAINIVVPPTYSVPQLGQPGSSTPYGIELASPASTTYDEERAHGMTRMNLNQRYWLTQ